MYVIWIVVAYSAVSLLVAGIQGVSAFMET